MNRSARILVSFAFFALLVSAANIATAEVHQGCQECFGNCVRVGDGTYGMTVCEDGLSLTLKDLGMTCETSGEICYQDSISIDVVGKDPFNDLPCSFWDWLMFGC